MHCESSYFRVAGDTPTKPSQPWSMAMVFRGTHHPLMPRKRTDSDAILACSSAVGKPILTAA